RVYFGHDDLGPHSRGALRHSAAAPPISAHYEIGPGEQPVGSPDYSVQRALARPVAVIEEVFGIRIVDRHNRVLKYPFFRHAPKPDHAGSRLFRTADYVGKKLSALGMKNAHKVSTVVHRNMRGVFKRIVNVAVISFLVLALYGKNGNSL